MVDPMERRDSELKERSLEYHKDSEDSSRITEKSEKDPSNGGGGNVDSGYHSFGCSSSDCNQCRPTQSSEMITTTTMGHNEDFPPPIPPRTDLFVNGFSQPLLDGKYMSNMRLRADIHDIADRGCNSLPDMSIMYRNSHGTTINPVLRASDSNFQQALLTPQDSQRIDPEAELAEKIAFFFKLGYTAEQVKVTLYKLGTRASKNDILMALGDVSSEPASLPTITFSESSQAFNEGKPGDLIGRGVNSSVELIPRGPSTVEDDQKEDEANASDNLRPIVIDGSNVAMSHGNKEYFSCKGIKLTVQYFLDRGHRDITVFVPKYRKEQTRPDAPIKDQEILTKLQEEKILVWTPSRHVAGRRITCYDDRFILKLAQETDGVIVSNDNFRDLQNEKPEWKEVIEKRLLMYSFVNDRFMPPDDPLGRNGPSLDNFLRIRLSAEEKRKPECPYGKKCTYGKKCKYFHPECSSSQRSVSEQIKDESRRRPPPSSAAKSLASEVMKDSALHNSPQHGGQNKSGRKDHENRGEDSRKRREEAAMSRHNKSHGESRRAISPLAGGACATTHSATNHTAAVHGALAQSHDQMAPGMSSMSNPGMSAVHADFQKMNLGKQYGDYLPNGGPFVGYPYNEGNSAGAEGRTPNGMSGGTHPLHMVPPALHSQVGRNVASSTSPRQNLPHLNMQHHSSPPAISMYDQTGMMGRQLNPAHHQPMFQNPHTYPAQQQFPQYPPQQQYSTAYMGLAYHQAMARHHMMMSMDPHLLAPQSNTQPLPQMSGYPYVYTPTTHQHQIQPQMVPQNNVGVPGNFTSPHSLDPTLYDPSNRQVYSSPNPVNPHPIMPRQPNSHGYKMPPIPQDQVSNASQPQFKNTSSPRYHLYRNLCGLFTRNTVERVLLSHPHESDAKKLAKMCLEMDG